MKTLLALLIIAQLLIPTEHSVTTSGAEHSIAAPAVEHSIIESGAVTDFTSVKYAVYGNIEGHRPYPIITKIASWDEFNFYIQEEIDQFGIQPSVFANTKYDEAFFTDRFLIVYFYGGSSSDVYDITSIAAKEDALEIGISFIYSEQDDYGEIQIVIELDQPLSDKEVRFHNTSRN